MTANGDSQIKIETSDLIQSDIQEIWRLMSEVNRWLEWNKSISFAQLEGVFVKGNPFKWTCGVNNRSILEDVIINKRIVLSTKSVGVKTLQRWDFKKTDESVLVSVSQSAEGWLTKIASQAVAKKLQKNQQEFLLSLKHTAEKA